MVLINVPYAYSKDAFITLTHTLSLQSSSKPTSDHAVYSSCHSHGKSYDVDFIEALARWLYFRKCQWLHLNIIQTLWIMQFPMQFKTKPSITIPSPLRHHPSGIILLSTVRGGWLLAEMTFCAFPCLSRAGEVSYCCLTSRSWGVCKLFFIMCSTFL